MQKLSDLKVGDVALMSNVNSSANAPVEVNVVKVGRLNVTVSPVNLIYKYYVFGKEDGYQKQTNFSHNHLYTYDEWAEARAKKEVVIRLHKLGLTSISHSRISYSSTTLNAVCDLLEEVIEYGELRSDTPPA